MIADEIAAHDRAVVRDGVSEVTDFAGLAVEFFTSARMNGEVLHQLIPDFLVVSLAQ